MVNHQEARQFFPRMIILITKEEERKRLEELFDQMHIPISYQVRGKGTATSEMLDIFGLSGTTRLLTVGILPKFWIEEFMQAAESRLNFHKRGGGIAITVPLVGMQHPIFHALNDEAKEVLKQKIQERMEEDMAEIKGQDYVVIWASVASGYSDEVIDAARSVGAKGGTILHGRQRHSERVSERFGISTQEERDFVMMVVPREKKERSWPLLASHAGLPQRHME